jgi:hypothetical protein
LCFGSRFGAPLGDHLIGEAASLTETGEHSPCALRRRLSLLRGVLGWAPRAPRFQRLRH